MLGMTMVLSPLFDGTQSLFQGSSVVLLGGFYTSNRNGGFGQIYTLQLAAWTLRV